MKRFTKPLLFLTVLLFLSISPFVKATTYGEFNLFIGNGGSIGFQNQIDKEIVLTVSSGALNCSNASLTMDKNHGRIIFMNNESVTFTTEFNVSRLQINGVLEDSGASTSQILNDVTVIEWWITIEPWLPFMFIFGMIGLVSMFTGPMYGIYKWKHGEYYEGARMSILLTAIGIGLTLAWLWTI